MREDNKFVTGSFTLSKEHIELSRLAGVDTWELIEQYLTRIEDDLQLEEGSLITYYCEANKDYNEYWYTEGGNVEYIKNFESKIYSFDTVNPTDN